MASITLSSPTTPDVNGTPTISWNFYGTPLDIVHQWSSVSVPGLTSGADISANHTSNSVNVFGLDSVSTINNTHHLSHDITNNGTQVPYTITSIRLYNPTHIISSALGTSIGEFVLECKALTDSNLITYVVIPIVSGANTATPIDSLLTEQKNLPGFNLILNAAFTNNGTPPVFSYLTYYTMAANLTIPRLPLKCTTTCPNANVIVFSNNPISVHSTTATASTQWLKSTNQPTAYYTTNNVSGPDVTDTNEIYIDCKAGDDVIGAVNPNAQYQFSPQDIRNICITLLFLLIWTAGFWIFNSILMTQHNHAESPKSMHVWWVKSWYLIKTSVISTTYAIPIYLMVLFTLLLVSIILFIVGFANHDASLALNGMYVLTSFIGSAFMVTCMGHTDVKKNDGGEEIAFCNGTKDHD